MTSAAWAQIARHPAFALTVGLWFATLVGLGLFVQRGEIIALIASGTGLAGLLPEGITGRMAISAGGALLGMLLGLAIAQRIALAHALDEEDEPDWEQSTDAPVERSVWLGDVMREPPVEQPRAHRVFNPREEIDEDGIAGPPPVDQWAEDHWQDELVEVESEDNAEDALMQAWREEQEPEPEPEQVQAEIETLDEFEAGEESLPDPPAPFVEVAAEEIDVAEIEPEDSWDVLAPEAELDETHEPEPALALRDEAFGDMSLDALTTRLGQALAAVRDAHPASPPPAELQQKDANPVIAFLRREAGRQAPGTDTASDYDDDPQAVLRSALDKLSRVSNPK